MPHKTYRKYITEQVFTKRLHKYVCPIKVSLINYIHFLSCSIRKIIYKFTDTKEQIGPTVLWKYFFPNMDVIRIEHI